MIGKYSMKLHYLKKNLNMEDITVADYTYPKRVCKDFKINNLGEYHLLYVHYGHNMFICSSDTLWSTDVFENF